MSSNIFIKSIENRNFDVSADTSKELFWQHEWIKHGTCCAAQIYELNSEAKFFEQGLKWLREFKVSAILESAGIIPGGKYKVVDLHNSVYEKLKKITSIHCIRGNDGENYLDEIRFCFSKALQLIDCHVTGNAEVVYRSSATNTEIVTNCNIHKDILYPIHLPNNTESTKRWKWPQIHFHQVVDLLKQSLL